MDEHRFQAVVAATALWMVVLAGAALADPDHVEYHAEAEQLPGGGQMSAAVSVTQGQDGGTPPGPKPKASGGTTVSHSLITYHWVPTGYECWYGDEHGEAVDGIEGAIIYQRVRVDRSTDPPTETNDYADCFYPGEAPHGALPPAPPPTLTEMSALARELIIVPDVRVSPHPNIGGVTGLETWFWYDGQNEVTTTAEIRGYSVTATMRPTRYHWDPDDRRGVVLESHRPGSSEDPAARWVYETKGDYSVRVQVVWDGTWSYTGSGVADSGDLPTIRATGATDYRVDEVRSELTGTR